MARGGRACNPADGGILRLCWRRDRQTFAFGDVIYVHEGPTKTNPSHDLAHLLIAANGGLPWLPRGESLRLAEYNAVFIETLLNLIRYAVVSRPLDGVIILKRTLRHARWFVEKHYAPFPVPAEEAYRLFCWEIDASVIGRLSPLFFDLRTLELLAPGGPEGGVAICFAASQSPPAVDAAAKFAGRVGEILGGIGGRRAAVGGH
jgi:hypothetical protein